jgi:hypothetical protein
MPPKRTPLRRVLLVLGVIVSVPVALLVLFILINLYDPALDPKAAEALKSAQPTVPDKDNAYFALFGIGVTPVQDPHQQGMEMVAKYNAWMRDAPGTPKDAEVLQKAFTARDQIMKPTAVLPWRGDNEKNLCNQPRLGCLTGYVHKRAQIDTLSQNNRVRLARYRSLYRYPNFRETIVERMSYGGAPFADFAASEHDTSLAEIGIKAVDGRVEDALHGLSEDTAYWRRVLAGTNSTVTKAIATAFLDRNYALLSEIAATYKTQPQRLALAQPMLTPLSADERNWNWQVMSDFQQFADLLLNIPNETGMEGIDPEMWALDWLPQRLVYKRRASVNLLYRQRQYGLTIATAPGDDYIGAIERTRDAVAATTRIPRLDMIYNPVGKVLIAIAEPSYLYARYAARSHNLEGKIRLVRLQIEMDRQHVPMDAIERHLETSPAELRDPYLKKPMRWDSTTRELWFDGVDPMGKGNPAELNHRIAVRIL